MKHIHYSCQGDSHVIANKVCQDASFSDVSDSMAIAIVCDGHGCERYFRSDIGAQKAIEATKECISSFIREIDESLFIGKEFTQKQAITSEAKTKTLTKDTETDKALRQLFSSIIYRWREKIVQHSIENPLTDEEKNKVLLQYQNDFTRNIGIEKTYGCTLMCYVATKSYWFAFHIGDGKCIAYDIEGNWYEPIPWDDRCFLNKTTSLCDSIALDEFRYCYSGTGQLPIAIFLGSDGIDDSFGATENTVNFYIQVLKLLVDKSEETAYKSLTETLPQLSKIGSKDDMSVSCVYDEELVRSNIKHFIDWQRNNVGENITILNNRIIKLQETINAAKSGNLNDKKVMIEFQYAQKDLEQAFKEKKVLSEKWNHFSKELLEDNYLPYKDEIGFGDVLRENSPKELPQQETEITLDDGSLSDNNTTYQA